MDSYSRQSNSCAWMPIDAVVRRDVAEVTRILKAHPGVVAAGVGVLRKCSRGCWRVAFPKGFSICANEVYV